MCFFSLILLLTLSLPTRRTIFVAALSSPRNSLKMITGKIQYLAGRRCVLIPRPKTTTIRNNEHATPLVLIGGTAQSIASWEHHLSSFSRTRDVLVYECLGQGPATQLSSDFDSLENYFQNVSLPVQANDFSSIVQAAFPSASQVDVAGFSFGGRVAMAAASTYPNLIRKLHITGVPAERHAYAQLILSSWKEILQNMDNNNDLRAFAWSSLLSSHSAEFLSQNPSSRVKTWVDFICRTNTVHGLAAILNQTHIEDVDDEWHPVSMAQRIVSQGSVVDGRLAVGSEDLLATVEEVQILNDVLGWGDVAIFKNSGHAVPMEQARLWKNDVLNFLDSDA